MTVFIDQLNNMTYQKSSKYTIKRWYDVKLLLLSKTGESCLEIHRSNIKIPAFSQGGLSYVCLRDMLILSLCLVSTILPRDVVSVMTIDIPNFS